MPKERNPGTHWIEGRACPRSGVDAVEMRKENLPPRRKLNSKFPVVNLLNDLLISSLYTVRNKIMT
jgi:hypothetical protein